MTGQGKGLGGYPDAPKGRRISGLAFLTLGMLLCTSLSVYARDAAFLDPGTAAGASAGDDAIRVEPKGDIDIGDSVLNVARNTDLFFVNQSGGPVKIEKVTVNGDGNVSNEIVSDDCSKQGTIPPGSRCSVEVSLTPSSPGPWTAQVLLTHDGAGRIARARLTGKTTGNVVGEKRDTGLALNSKESTPVNFGDVNADDGGKVVRSALMVNDSNEPITLYSIDVIEASNGLQKLEQGCAVDMELKPGESCPVTLVWSPTTSGQISTDLIIRHSGRLGFAVVPIRGKATGESKNKPPSSESTESKNDTANNNTSSKGGIPAPPGARDLEREVGSKIPAVSDKDLAGSMSGASSASVGSRASIGTFYLIGTVGNRAVILKPNGKTEIVNAGDDMDVDGKEVKVLLVTSKSVDLMIDAKKKTIALGSSPVLIEKASLAGKRGDKPKDREEAQDFSSSTSSPPSAAPNATSINTTSTPSSLSIGTSGNSVSGVPSK